MPAMPIGDPKKALGELRRCEVAIRTGKTVAKEVLARPGYWGDLIRLLQVYRHSVDGYPEAIRPLKSRMSSNYFNIYIRKRQRKQASQPVFEQLSLQFAENGRLLAPEKR